MDREGRQESKQREKAKHVVVGNARSCFQQHTTVHEKTFDKKRDAKEKKEKSLKRIAKLLKKTKKEMAKKAK
jgi:hypothetical protein